jgi:hypothetical protein
VYAPGSAGGFGKDNTFFWLFFMTTLIPLIQGKGKASFFQEPLRSVMFPAHLLNQSVVGSSPT